MLERHIIQARARATAEEERFLNKYKEDVPENYKDVPLPPGKGQDNLLLKFKPKRNRCRQPDAGDSRCGFVCS